MTHPVTARFALTLTLLAATTGCSWFGRKPKAPPTPPPPVPVVAPEPQPPQPQPQPEPAQPEPQPPAPQPTPAPQPQPPQPPKPKPQPPAPKPAPPAFGQILTPQQQQNLLKSYQQSAAVARGVLNRIQGRALNRDQAEAANRIRSFLLQAQEAQSKDPSTAAQLAHRAEVLARDLQSTLH